MKSELRDRLVRLGHALVDQKNSRVLVPANEQAPGFWFGGGNMVLGQDGELVVCGRYRNAGDSRTGVSAGERGLELAVFSTPDAESPLEKCASYSKADLSVEGAEVVSIEGVSLFIGDEGPELYVSTEKKRSYPAGYEEFQKGGTGVWTIDVLKDGALQPVLESKTASTLHVKDPVVFRGDNGETSMIYCVHPHTWSSSNAGLAISVNEKTGFMKVSDDILPRGPVWDVACSRITARLRVPRMGAFKSERACSLYFYDGAECLRALDENPLAAKRPRGYSCEELGGLAFGYDDEFP